MNTQPAPIVFVLPSFAGGGAERVTLTLLRTLDRALFKPTLLVMNGKGPLSELVPPDVEVLDLRTARLRQALPALVSAIRQCRPDLVFSTLGYVNLALLALRIFLPSRTKIVVREANMPSLSLPGTANPILMRMGYRWFYPQAAGVICTSTRMMDEMRDDFAVQSQRLHMLGNPVDEAAIRSAAALPLRHPGDGLRLVAAGRLTRQKGFDRMLEMMAQLDESTHLTLLGDGDERQALEQAIHERGLQAQVALKGFCANPWAHYAGADAVVVPSRWEGLPNVVLEALACGTPVIATPESGGISDIAAAAPTGVLSVASVGRDFIAAIRAIVPRVPGEITLRASLLPEDYHVASIASAFGDILMKCRTI